MTWNLVFPTGPTLISDSVIPFQQNWAFLQTNIGIDHYFNTGAPNEGHHKFVQTIGTGADAALSAGMNGVLYNKTTGTANIPQPFWQQSADNFTRQIPTIFTGTVVYAGGNVLTPVINMATKYFSNGLFFIYQLGSLGTFAQCIVVWDNVAGGQVTFVNLDVGGITLTVTGNSTINMQSAVAGNYRWQLFTIPN